MKKSVIFSMLFLAIFFIAAVRTASANTPKAAYDRYMKAVKAGNKAQILNSVTKERKAEFEKFSKSEQDQTIKMIQAFSPKTYKVVKENIQGNRATLTVSGTVQGFTGGTESASGTVTMLKEDGAWKIQQEDWKSGSSTSQPDKSIK